MALLNDIDENSDLAQPAMGIALIKLGRLDEAEAALRKALARFPDSVQA
jgi:hypothetical protein